MRHRTEPEDRRKETAPAVNLGQQDSRDRGQAGWVDDQWSGLPLFGRQRDRGQQFPNLLVERPFMVEVCRHRDSACDAAPNQFADGSELCIGERMAEVEEEHESGPNLWERRQLRLGHVCEFQNRFPKLFVYLIADSLETVRED